MIYDIGEGAISPVGLMRSRMLLGNVLSIKVTFSYCNCSACLSFVISSRQLLGFYFCNDAPFFLLASLCGTAAW